MGRYEETLQIKLTSDSIRDPETGDFVPGPENDFTSISDCREEPNDKGNTIEGTDGERVTYGSVIQLPEDCPEIARGCQVRVLDFSGTIILEGTAKRFKRYRKNCRLWV